jgi:serine/threonine protein kinase
MTESSSTHEILGKLRVDPTKYHSQLVPDGTPVFSGNEMMQEAYNTTRRLGMGTHAEVYEVESTTSPDYKIAMKVEKPIDQIKGIIDREITVFEKIEKLGGLDCVPRYFDRFSMDIDGVTCTAFGLELFEESINTWKKREFARDDKFINLLILIIFFNLIEFHKKLKILHRDIKPSNIMFKFSPSPRPRVRIGFVDLGSAKDMESDETVELRGTGAYLGVRSDPTNPSVMDDYWAGIWSVVEITEGLPWKGISARQIDGREKINLMKIEFINNKMKNLQNSKLSEIISKLFQIDSESDSTNRLVQISKFQNFISNEFSINFTNSEFLTIISPPPLTVPPGVPIEDILTGRVELLPVEDFSVKFNLIEKIDKNVEKYHFAQFADLTDEKILKTSNGTLICIDELFGGGCGVKDCPLLHHRAEGLFETALGRWINRSGATFETIKMAEIDSIYTQKRIPAGPTPPGPPPKTSTSDPRRGREEERRKKSKKSRRRDYSSSPEIRRRRRSPSPRRRSRSPPRRSRKRERSEDSIIIRRR